MQSGVDGLSTEKERVDLLVHYISILRDELSEQSRVIKSLSENLTLHMEQQVATSETVDNFCSIISSYSEHLYAHDKYLESLDRHLELHDEHLEAHDSQLDTVRLLIDLT